jgi:hypothetical protein
MTLGGRVKRLEAAQQKARGLEPYTVSSEDGQVSARITPLRGKPPVAWVTYDCVSLEAEEAQAAILPLLPPCAVLFVSPRVLTPREWEAHYSTKLREEPPPLTPAH